MLDFFGRPPGQGPERSENSNGQFLKGPKQAHPRQRGGRPLWTLNVTTKHKDQLKKLIQLYNKDAANVAPQSIVLFVGSGAMEGVGSTHDLQDISVGIEFDRQ